jgi:cytochrome P450 family 12
MCALNVSKFEFFLRQGHKWQNMRTAVNPILMHPQLVKSYIPLIDCIVNEFIANIPKIQDKAGEMPEDFQNLLNHWSLESITAITLEKRLGLMNLESSNEDGNEIQKLIRKIITLGVNFEMKPSIWKIYETKEFKELMQAYDGLTE